MADDKKAAAAAETNPIATSADTAKVASVEEAAKLPNPILGAQQPMTAASGSGAMKQDAGDAEAKRKKVEEAKKALADAEKELGALQGAPETKAEEDQKMAEERMKSKEQDIVVIGKPGGFLNIDGSGFGAQQGVVMIGGRVVPVTRWNDTSIKGSLPADLPKDGEVTVQTSSGNKTGKWPPPHPKAAPAGRSKVKLADGSVVEGEIVQ